MEENMTVDDYIFERQIRQVIIPRNRTKIQKPPTRLQKQAPPSLKLDQVSISSANTNPFVPSTNRSSSLSLTPIPLLSPLILSPTSSFPQEIEEFRFPVIRSADDHMDNAFMFPVMRSTDGIDNCCCSEDDKTRCSSIDIAGGDVWRRPAVGGGYVEPSSLLNTFQSKCVLVNRTVKIHIL